MKILSVIRMDIKVYAAKLCSISLARMPFGAVRVDWNALCGAETLPKNLHLSLVRSPYDRMEASDDSSDLKEMLSFPWHRLSVFVLVLHKNDVLRGRKTISATHPSLTDLCAHVLSFESAPLYSLICQLIARLLQLC